MTCTEVFERMEEKFKEFDLPDIHGVFQFNIPGEAGGQWHAVCQGRSCQVSPGRYPRPDVTVTVNAENAVRLAEGRLHPALALLTRKVKVRGDMLLAARVQRLLAGRI